MVKASIQAINISHHSGRPVIDVEMVAKEFLSPASDNMDLTVVVEDFLHGATVADPIEHSSPKILFVLGDSPATTSSLANE